jgi:hypothetical protein
MTSPISHTTHGAVKPGRAGKNRQVSFSSPSMHGVRFLSCRLHSAVSKHYFEALAKLERF